MSARVSHGDPGPDGRPTLRIEVPAELALEPAVEFSKQLAVAVRAAQNRVGYGIRVGELAISQCGHAQREPTGAEMAGNPEIIARRCAVCARELRWAVTYWARL